MNEDKNTSVKRLVIYTLITVLILFLILVLFLYLVRSPLIFRSGAYSSNISNNKIGDAPAMSIENSYVFASPLRARVGGEQVRITVYILNDKGLGMPGKKVSIGSGSKISVNPIQPVTDSVGRATFDISGNTSGVYLIQAETEGVTITQRATVTFD